jgi:hypothetical protein
MRRIGRRRVGRLSAMLALSPGVSLGATAQLLGRLEPIYFRRPIRTTPAFPQLMSELGDLFVPECGNAMTHGWSFRSLMTILPVLMCLARVFSSRQVFRISLLLADPMSMCGDIV